MKGRYRYSQLLIDEAVRLYELKEPLQRIVKLTGVHEKTIYLEWRKYCARIGKPLALKRMPSRYTLFQKRKCIRTAIRLYDTGMAKGMKIAFIKAGQIMGIKGKSIYEQWMNGVIRGIDQDPSQHSGGGSGSAKSGACNHEAKLQSQRCLEQNKELVSMRPAPKMIKRRRYTSDMITPGLLKGHRVQ